MKPIATGIETSKNRLGFQTACTHGGDHWNKSGHLSPPICQSTAFEFPTTSEGAVRAADIKADEFYGRWGSRNERELEALIAALEEADDALCASSGLGAISMITHAFLNPGDHFIAVHNCYSETKILHESLAEQLSVDVTFIDSSDIHHYKQAIQPNTKLVFAETPANPTLSLVDISKVATLVHEQSDAVFVVDSTFATPYNQKPLKHGADIVVHSATKYLGGHSDVVAGVCAGSTELIDKVRHKYSFHGPHLDPFGAWLLCRGIRTLGLRMEKHNENALKLAQFLETHPKIRQVFYPFSESHPQYKLATKQMTGGGGMICFELKDGMDGGLGLISNVKLNKMAVSLGGYASTITHPASMTHNLLPREEREKGGITDGMIRFSVGIEEYEDIRDDLSQALDKI
ncbi:aminotransferase class I/II-fold pyridoxal phosphate-dependent enzyme [Shouchella clausii]|uniref:homocysteine desulfhydrase n=2 Tax=Shouchella TaxID=2893057 RepID=Q5WAZ1_SHOC1|nr:MULTISPECIES: aminotransferase class I/II-fold pyridoxal phosphate-dependent enzyme [Shouchella]MCM3311274.1 aminotransferase class I/II-fold pyridoxal phosphate-dependent enzyme [Psychrobacillus sp. MER TA 17]ALA53083.1 O-acetylhomoserine sulfhydrylase [Shouchella clausii]MBU3231368.1 aminotransferase class I/II-fold pyridoxal phosphate-dependent enzyme [Shouchella clausii]MBU3263629.1 aminotransferase class I/II-fold pyridoxal phosphate-dependent enzyme [Shouchella clausii]MBU3508020.1 am